MTVTNLLPIRLGVLAFLLASLSVTRWLVVTEFTHPDEVVQEQSVTDPKVALSFAKWIHYRALDYSDSASKSHASEWMSEEALSDFETYVWLRPYLTETVRYFPIAVTERSRNADGSITVQARGQLYSMASKSDVLLFDIDYYVKNEAGNYRVKKIVFRGQSPLAISDFTNRVSVRRIMQHDSSTFVGELDTAEIRHFLDSP